MNNYISGTVESNQRACARVTVLQIAGRSAKPLAIEDQPAIPPAPPQAPAMLALENKKPEVPRGNKHEKSAGVVSKKSTAPASQKAKIQSGKFVKSYKKGEKERPRRAAATGVPELEPEIPASAPPTKRQKTTGRAGRRAVGSIREVAV